MTPKKASQIEQSRRFIEAAREIGVDEEPEAFKQRLKRLVKSSPKTKDSKKEK